MYPIMGGQESDGSDSLSNNPKQQWINLHSTL